MVGHGAAPEPRVTVIMPTFEQAAFIPGAVGSLCAQTLREWERVVVDDGSRGGTQETLSRFLPDARIRVRRFPANRGLGAACNAGLELARSDVVAYLPSDDRYDSTHLSALLATTSTGRCGLRFASGGPPRRRASSPASGPATLTSVTSPSGSPSTAA